MSDQNELPADRDDFLDTLDSEEIDTELDPDAIWEVFREQDYSPIDPAEIWDQLSDRDPETTGSETLGFDNDHPRQTSVDAGERTSRSNSPVGEVIPKAKYCEQCQHFSMPPDATCTAAAVEQFAFIDRHHVRVVGCPVVADRPPEDSPE